MHIFLLKMLYFSNYLPSFYGIFVSFFPWTYANKASLFQYIQLGLGLGFGKCIR